MIDLYEEFKKITPDESDDEIDQGITMMQSKFPNLDDISLVAKAREIHQQQTNPAINASSISSSMKPTPMQLNNPSTDPTSKTPEGMLASYSPEARSQAQAQADAENSSTRRRIGDALQIFGQGFFKNPDIAGAIKNTQAERDRTDAKYLGAFDRNRAASMQDVQQARLAKEEGREDIKFSQEQEQIDRKKDINSDISMAYRDLVKEMGVKADVSKLSAADIEERFPIIAKKFEVEERRKDRAASLAIQKESAFSKLDEKQKSKIKALRGELTHGPVVAQAYNNYLLAKRGTEIMNEFKKDPSGYSDYGTLMLGLKSLQGDNSVVRESEIYLGKNATSTINKAINFAQQAANGKSLQPSQREEMIKTMGILTKASRKIYADVTRPIYEQAKSEGLPLDQIFPTGSVEFFEDAPTKGVTATTPKEGDVEDGYKFLGGDPKDPKNWEKA